VTRSRREGRWADLPSGRARFVFEAAFLLLVALGAALMELRPLGIILLMACALLLVALIERASSREEGRAPIDEEAAEELPLAEGEAEPAPAMAATAAHSRWSWRRRRPAELPSPTAALEAMPSSSHVRRIEPPDEAEVGAAELGAQSEEVSAQPEEAPGPVVTKRPLDLPGLEQPPVSIPAPRPRRSLARAARGVAQPAQPPTPPAPPPAREWNLWDLERRAREQAGNAPRDEEWSALFTHLRVFANADGVLPKEFDELVRESFGELIEAA
jgi:hypothetical protein